MRLAVVIDPLRRVAIILASSALLSPLPASVAAEETQPGTVQGIVVDRVTRLAVASATIAVRPGGVLAQTGTDGRFTVSDVASGAYRLIVHASGYADLLQDDVRVESGAVKTLMLELEPNHGQARGGLLTESAPDAARRKVPPAVSIGVGVALERRQASDPIGTDEWGVAFLPRFIKRGLAPAVSLPWTRVAAGGPMRPGNSDVGSIRMRPTMIGVTWQEPIGKGLVAELRMTGGYSFNSVRQPDPNRGTQDAGPAAFTNADGSMAWEPRLAVWRDVGPRTGIMVAARYLHTRPMLTFTDGTRYRLNADRVTVEFGFAFTLLKAPRAQ